MVRTLAITPTKSRSMEFEEVRRVCHDYTMTGLKEMFTARDQKETFRFLYMSGSAAERDPSKTPTFMPEYCLMRGETENQILTFAAEQKGDIEVCVVKPGLINKPGWNAKSVFTSALKPTGVLPSILVTEISAAMIEQIVNGFEKEPLMNDDLVRIGQKALKAK